MLIPIRQILQTSHLIPSVITCRGSVTVPSTSNKHKISFLPRDIFKKNNHKRNSKTLIKFISNFATFTQISSFKIFFIQIIIQSKY